MEELPKVIASSVIRSSQQGESHGGLYIIDLETEEINQVLDWDTVDISWEGRGKDRGLRGIAFYNDRIILAASDEIYFFDQSFNKVDSYNNKYLKHCHEIHRYNEKLYLTSTGFDSIIEFDLNKKEFTKGYEIRFNNLKWFLNRLAKKFFGEYAFPIPNVNVFNPYGDDGPDEFDQIHINNVATFNGKISVSGRRINKLYGIYKDEADILADLPFGTHNATLLSDNKVIMNNTSADSVCITTNGHLNSSQLEIPQYPEQKLKMDHVPKDHARQGFGRGLTMYKDTYLIAGSSPATVSIYDLNSMSRIKSVNITMDVRNSIHGLEIWPF